MMGGPKGSMGPLSTSDNGWKRNIGAQSSKLDAVKKQIKGVLNKMTPQRFDKLVGQLCAIEMESVEMQEALIALVFEKVRVNYLISSSGVCQSYGLLAVRCG
jgi:translation initiation factor 4G